ncbi:MAG: hypothetical protein IH991_21170 [Planctomycetes bacterium]|nr:hypothetical protein [Planctomycetota bacterium]
MPIDASTMGLMKGAFRCATMPLYRITLTTEKPPDLGIGPLWDQRLGGE